MCVYWLHPTIGIEEYKLGIDCCVIVQTEQLAIGICKMEMWITNATETNRPIDSIDRSADREKYMLINYLNSIFFN